MEEKKTQSFGLRITQSLEEDLKKIYDETGIPATNLAFHALKSISEYYSEHGEIRCPFVVIPKKHFSEMKKRSELGVSKIRS